MPTVSLLLGDRESGILFECQQDTYDAPPMPDAEVR